VGRLRRRKSAGAGTAARCRRPGLITSGNALLRAARLHRIVYLFTIGAYGNYDRALVDEEKRLNYSYAISQTND
jgi:hypothetical protein